MSLIVAKQLSKEYVMGSEIVRALQNIDFCVEKGEYVAIVGPSGSGKSTLMHLIGCLDSPTSGTYWLNQRKVSQLSERTLAQVRNQEIGFIFQTFNLLPRFNAVENVCLPLVYAGISKKERTQKGMHVLEQVGLLDRAKHRPSELSGGQRQRVAVARALINQPSMLLADEPTGNLDSQTSEDILKLFEQLQAKGHTLLVVTHDEEVAARSLRRILLRDGKIASDKKPAKLKPAA